MVGSRLTVADVEGFLGGLAAEGLGELAAGPSLEVGGQRMWLTLLDDATAGQLRVRKLVLSSRGSNSREWFTTDPGADRWQELASDAEHTAEGVLAVVRATIYGLWAARRRS